MSQNNITLPPLKHVFQGLFNSQPQSKQHRQRSTSSGGYPSMESVEAARSLQQLSSVNQTCCYHCAPTPMNTQFFSGHRRAVSASTEMSNRRYPHSHPHHPVMVNQQMPNQHVAPMSSLPGQPPMMYPNQQFRRARAHTTSGYPPTMLFEPHVYNNDNNNNNQQTNDSQMMMMMRGDNVKSTSNSHRYHCQHCRKSFSRPSSLRIHIYSHTGEKPFKCHHQGCGRSFSVHSNMRRHLRVHYYPQQQQQQQQHNSMRLPIVPTNNYD
ncbi:hypothetical protein INT47_001059, partial [Mucor saturninus]